MRHLLVTNDFPPKIGGIQSYLWELWRRLPASDVTVLTTPYAGDAAFDAEQAYRVVRTRQRWLLPTPQLIRHINDLAREVGAELVVLDPALPLGLVGPHLELPYVVIGHGAEIVIPGRLPLARHALARVLHKSAGIIASGKYVERFVQSWPTLTTTPLVSVPPGVDTDRFVPLSADARAAVRQRFGLPLDAPVVIGVSRLVKRKGFDRLIEAAAQLRSTHPDLVVAIAGKGRDDKRLRALAAEQRAPVRFLGRVADEDLPGLYGAGDVFCMPCHDRWWGLEREGFGIVFVEAAAAGVPSVAGMSGGSDEAVLDGVTGAVVTPPVTAEAVAQSLATLIDDPLRRGAAGTAARERSVEHFAYGHLVRTLDAFLARVQASAAR